MTAKWPYNKSTPTKGELQSIRQMVHNFTEEVAAKWHCGRSKRLPFKKRFSAVYFLPGRHTLDRKAVSEANFNVAYAPREGYNTLQYPTYKSKGSAYSIHSGTLKSKFDVTQLIHIFNIIFVIIRINIKIQDITNNRWPYNILVLKYRFYCLYPRNTNENT